MAEPILTAAELISFLEGQCKQSDSDRDDWKLMTERLQRVIKHHENVGAELRASIAQLETHNAALSGGWKALECELAESSRVLKQTNSALNSQQNESRRLEAENQRLRSDWERLDWAEKNYSCQFLGSWRCDKWRWYFSTDNQQRWFDTLRSAIDAAKSQEG